MTPPTAGPDDGPAPEIAFDRLLADADAAREQRVWESAVSLYNRALRLRPADARARIGLGRSYEGLAGAQGGPFLISAADHYRAAIKSDPAGAEAHDALLAVSAKAGRLDDLLEEYRALLKSDPDNPLLQAAVRKMRALLLASAPAGRPAAEAPPLSRGVLRWLVPIAAAGSFLAALYLRYQSMAPELVPFSGVLFRLSALLAALYVLARLFFRA